VDTQPIFIAPGDGRTIRNPAGGMLTFMAGSEETGGAVTMWESTAAPGEGPPLHLHVTGGGKGSNSVWMSIEPSPELVTLHEQLLQAAEPFEVTTGDSSAFFGDDARDRDVRWVREFRHESSFDLFTPHITLGHASNPPAIEPMSFVATTVAVCHLGRFCTCRRIVRAWNLARA